MRKETRQTIRRIQVSIWSQPFQRRCEPRDSFWKDRFIGEFGPERIRKVRADKYPYEYGVLVTVTEKDLARMFRLIEDIEGRFEEKGVNLDIALTTSD